MQGQAHSKCSVNDRYWYYFIIIIIIMLFNCIRCMLSAGSEDEETVFLCSGVCNPVETHRCQQSLIVSSGHHNKVPQAGGSDNRTVFAHSSGGGRSKIKVPQG